MEEFNTLEKVKSLFDEQNCNGNTNCYFICYRDTTKDGMKYGALGAVGGALGAVASFSQGALDAMEKSDGYLFNWTEEGIGIIPLNYKGVMLTVNPSKMEAQKDSYIFINNEDIDNILVKNFNIFNSKVKKIKITFKDGKTKMELMANVKEKLIPYQEENFSKFVEKFFKK